MLCSRNVTNPTENAGCLQSELMLLTSNDKNIINLIKVEIMKKIAIAGLMFAALGAEYASAAPLFSLGQDNVLGFQAVGNKTGAPALTVGDKFFGVANVQDNTVNGGVIWNAQNVSSPYDSFSGYFVTEIKKVTAISFGSDTLYSVEMGVATSDPNGVMSATDLAAGTIMKLFTDTTSPYTSGGLVGTDIANATNGALWASLGMPSAGGYWNVLIAPSGSVVSSGSTGGINFITNNTGMNWAKVADPGCTSGCDMVFTSTFSRLAGAWQFGINDPATIHPLVVPLPAAAWLLGSGLIGLIGLTGLARRRL